MSLFRVDASLFPGFSASRALGDLVEAEWLAAHPGAEVMRRDLTADPIRFESWAAAVSAGSTPEADRTPEQREATALARTLADELVDAEALLFTFPLYNYGVPQHVKAWFDLAYTDERINPYGTALRGKPAVLVTSLGGNYDEGAPKHGWDHSTPWMRRALEDVWGLDLEVVRRSFTLVGVDPSLDRFADTAAAHKAETEDHARQAGRALSAKLLRAA
jgi:FMN-dependent NADH-azoreductase